MGLGLRGGRRIVPVGLVHEVERKVDSVLVTALGGEGDADGDLVGGG